MRVYVVEDDPSTRRLLEAGLAEVGQVQAFEAAEAAQEAIAAGKPDLLLTDVRLPGLSGLELCAWVRERHSRLELPIMILSSADEVEQVARGYEVGADEYLLKPFELSEVQHKARLLLGRGEHRSGERWTRYALQEQLGKGATAAIWRARRQADEAELALKVVPQAAGAGAVAGLLAEAELLRSLGEVSGIVQVRDMGSDGGCTYYAMELIPGPTLSGKLEARDRLDVSAIVKLGRSLAVSLSELAAAGVIHGDVKPENVLVGDEGPVLIDFGLARRSGMPERGRGGTPAYLAPEVVRGEPTSHQSDVYALGVVLFEALTGRKPYAVTGAELAALKVEGAEPDLEPLLALDLPPGLVAVVEEALAPDPSRRTASATDVAMALLPYAG